MNNISRIGIRKILNSNGDFAYEAEVELEGTANGTASSPAAIVPGRREKHTTAKSYPHEVIESLIQTAQTQSTLDQYLTQHIDELGADISLAVSLAFARASSTLQNTSLVEYIRNLFNFLKCDRHIAPLIPIFSGGIHDYDLGGSMQQIMLKIDGLDFGTAVIVICKIYSEIEEMLTQRKAIKGLAASSGFLVNDFSIEEEFAFLTDIINASEVREHLSIAVDVAAEHLKTDSGYQFYNKLYTADEFEELLYSYCTRYPITYIEDPFDCSDVKNWISLHTRLKNTAEIISDDYTATQIEFFDDVIADGFIIKMKQVGTLSGTLDIVSKIYTEKLKTCVSHRSCETEDTFMCDLAVAVNADYMKIGGPRRGDRVEKYNRLIRLYGVSL